MLNVVVLPAPFGPMIPTISSSPAVMVTSEAACSPPKRMLSPLASSTDIGDLHLLHASDAPVPRTAAQPLLHRRHELADATREPRQHEQEHDGPDHARRPFGG